jgi:hypothetical protein
MFRHFRPSEIIIPIIVVLVFSVIVSPTPLVGAVIVFFVTQVIVRGIRYSRRP